MLNASNCPASRWCVPIFEFSPRRFDRHGAYKTRFAVCRTIDKDHRLRLRDFFYHLRRPLLIAQYTHSRIIAPVLFGPLRKKRPDAVIFAERVAAGEDETSGRKSHAVIVLTE